MVLWGSGERLKLDMSEVLWVRVRFFRGFMKV